MCYTKYTKKSTGNLLPALENEERMDIFMTTSTIYTIEREFGSGGHIVGEKLAKLLDIPFYDSQIVDMAAKMRASAVNC